MSTPFNIRKRYTSRFLFFPVVAAAFALVLSAVVMWLWNAILPKVLHIGTIGYWQAVGLLVLCRILFGNFGRGGGPPRIGRNPGFLKDDKWMQMTPEDRDRFKDRWKEHCRDNDKK